MIATGPDPTDPAEVVALVERVALAVLADASIGRTQEVDDALAAELAGLAERVVDTWLPGFRPTDLAPLFGEEAISPATARPSRHASLGWAPLAVADLVALAAPDLARPAAAAARSAYLRELAATTELARSRADAADRVGVLASLFGGARVEAELEATAAFDAQRHRLLEAREALAGHVTAALEVLPPLRVALLALASARLLRAPPIEAGAVATGSSAVRPTPGLGRAIVLTSLHALRGAVGDAFPEAAAAVHLAGGARGPYRQRPAGDDAIGDPSTDAADHAWLVNAGVERELERALRHAKLAAMAAWRREEPKGAALETALTPGEVERHHSRLLETCTAGLEQLALGGDRDAPALLEATLQVRATIDAIVLRQESTAPPGDVERPTGPHSTLVGVEPCQGALARLAERVGRMVGVTGSKEELALALAEGLAQGDEGTSAVEGDAATPLRRDLAAALELAGYADDLVAMRAAKVRLARAVAAERAAEQEITWTDRLNVFTDSPAEARKAEAFAEGAAATRDRDAARERARATFDAALAEHPRAAIVFELEAVAEAVRAIRVHYDYRNSRWNLTGKEEAAEALRRWTDRMIAVLGPLEPAAEIIERYARARLVRG